jgi:polyhydroxybutyrate depolymerase
MSSTFHSLEIDGLPRQYIVYQPNEVGNQPLPAVLILHGAGATANWTLEEMGWLATADNEGLLLIAPEGMRLDPSRPPNFFDNPQVWNDSGSRGMLGPSKADDMSFLRAMLDRVTTDYSIDPRRVYVTGFSNGACMTFRVGAEISERFAALAPVAGLLRFEDPRPAFARPTLFLIGSADPLIPLAGGEVTSPWDGTVIQRPPVGQTLARWAEAIGCPSEPAQVTSRDGVQISEYGPGRDNATISVYVVDGLGHHWPGGRGRFNPRIAGPPSDRLRANDVIWEFFRQHPLQ